MIRKLFLIKSLIFITACSDDNDKVATTNCDTFSTLVNQETFDAIDLNLYGITNVDLYDNCLTITIGSSGCDPNNWTMHLISSENISETLPNQRYAKVELINNDACLAVFEKTVSFDLTPLQIKGQNQVIIHLENWSESISYSY